MKVVSNHELFLSSVRLRFKLLKIELLRLQLEVPGKRDRKLAQFLEEEMDDLDKEMNDSQYPSLCEFLGSIEFSLNADRNECYESISSSLEEESLSMDELFSKSLESLTKSINDLCRVRKKYEDLDLE